ncbi:AAA family ATPase [Shinella sp.]|uniref:AAA family ATPase n=1 Tax=Shinella sp. TaxID=1870904 RepID=UPI003F6F4366
MSSDDHHGVGKDPGLGQTLEPGKPEELFAIDSSDDPILLNDGDGEFALINASSFGSKKVKERVWLVDGLIPQSNVTLLSGDGGTGKSLLVLQLAFSVATGSPWLGYKVPRGNVLFVSAEDEPDEIHRRLACIVEAEGKSFSDLFALDILSLAERGAIFAKSKKSDEGKLAITKLYNKFEEWVDMLRPTLIVLDTLADFYAGDENNRAETREFVSMLRRVGIKCSSAIVVLSHPSQQGMTSGAGTSGSTAWSNSCRSRLYFETDENRRKSSKGKFDPDVRYLSLKKANYSQAGGEICVSWLDGRFVRKTINERDVAGSLHARIAKIAKPGAGVEVATSQRQPLAQAGEEKSSWMGSQHTTHARADDQRPAAEAVFLSLMQAALASGTVLSNRGGRNFAPKILAAEAGAMGYSAPELAAAMNSLLQQNRISAVQVGPPSRLRSELKFVADDASNAHGDPE